MVSTHARAAALGTLAPEVPAHLVDDLRTLVTVTRTHTTDIGVRQVFVRVDGGPSVALVHGESFTLEVRPGAHRLRAHNTLFWKHIPFHVEAGEHLEFIVINRGGRFTFPLVALMGVAPLYLSVQCRSLK